MFPGIHGLLGWYVGIFFVWVKQWCMMLGGYKIHVKVSFLPGRHVGGTGFQVPEDWQVLKVDPSR